MRLVNGHLARGERNSPNSLLNYSEMGLSVLHHQTQPSKSPSFRDLFRWTRDTKSFANAIECLVVDT